MATEYSMEIVIMPNNTLLGRAKSAGKKTPSLSSPPELGATCHTKFGV